MKGTNLAMHHLLPDNQMSDAFINSVFLALSGGLQDAYTYNCRSEIFANAQTGNIVLMSQRFMEGQWREGILYLIPLLAFAAGVMAAEKIQNRYQYAERIHWRQGILIAEIVILAIVGFIPQSHNIAAAAIVSFVCAMQVQAFRKVAGYSYASTMCIGNLRSGVASLSSYLRGHDPRQLRKVKHYFGVIGAFAIGAGTGGICTSIYGTYTIWISCVLLSGSVLLMFLEKLR